MKAEKEIERKGGSKREEEGEGREGKEKVEREWEVAREIEKKG